MINPLFGSTQSHSVVTCNLQNTDRLEFCFADVEYRLTGDHFSAYEGDCDLGYSEKPWDNIWANHSHIDSSDERKKRAIQPVPDTVLDAWEDVQWCQYQFITGDRLHCGLIAQRINAVFKARGLDACDYGLLCYDKWAARPAVIVDGVVIEPAHEAGDVWALRYAECFAMEAACQRRRADRVESRLAALERAAGINSNS